jgi:hypothetical protein
MVYDGHVKNGVVVFDSASPPEGSAVRVHLATEPAFAPAAAATSADVDALWDELMKLAGKAEGLPSDMAARHDHYRRERQKR